MSETLVILGAGGHARVCYEVAQMTGQWKDYVFLDDQSENTYLSVSGPLSDFNKYSGADFFVAMGANLSRKEWFDCLEAKEESIVSLIHPSAIISATASIGKGTVIMPGVIINAFTQIGKGTILNTAATVNHDNDIGDFVHLSPGVHLAGAVKVGNLSWLGIGSNVINNIKIGSSVVIGAASLVIRDIPLAGTYIGSPTRLLKES